MSLIESLTSYFSKSKDVSQNEVPEGLCPNCWGNQKYDNVIREMYVDKQVDVNNKEANHAFIKDFVVKHVDGIQLKKGNTGLECPTCHIVQS